MGRGNGRESCLVVGPLLRAHLDAGRIWLEGSEYVGSGADGVVVTIGHQTQCHVIERYLAHNPEPKDW